MVHFNFCFDKRKLEKITMLCEKWSIVSGGEGHLPLYRLNINVQYAGLLVLEKASSDDLWEQGLNEGTGNTTE